jgi:hypothetical protein
MDGGSVAIGREPIRPTAMDGGSVVIGKEPMRPTAMDGSRLNLKYSVRKSKFGFLYLLSLTLSNKRGN